MASITTPLFNTIIHSSIFTSKTPLYPVLSISAKPIKFQHQLSFSLIRNNLSSIIASVAQNPEVELLVEEEGDHVWDDEGLDDTKALLTSDWAEESKGGFNGIIDGNGGALPSEEAKLYVGNLPFDMEPEELAALFNQAGTVEQAEIIIDRLNNRSRGFGFVTMGTVEEAENAAKKFNSYALNGRNLNVNKAAPKGSRVERPPRVYENARIYVGNLPWDIDNSQLLQIFSEHGKVIEARVVLDRDTNRSRGFGFVTMTSQTEMNDAISALDGKSMNGRPIRVNVAEERPRTGFS